MAAVQVQVSAILNELSANGMKYLDNFDDCTNYACEVEDEQKKNCTKSINTGGAKRKLDKQEDYKNLKTNEAIFSNIVAAHYNNLAAKGFVERSKSRIFYMRNFHNWIKSILIMDHIKKIKERKKPYAPICVMDMCCGKGGDLLKWQEGAISHLICSDIASVSLEQCKTRYADIRKQSAGDNNIYTIEYIAADCSRERLRDKYQDPSMKLDLVNCQFAFHYSFESLAQAECMMQNAAESLQLGGYFIGTILDANELMARVQKSGSNTFGNDVYSVTFECDTEKPPLFGAKYNFHLDTVVDCPEFLVYFAVLVKLANKYGLKLISKERFADFFARMKSEKRKLGMNCLETYPAPLGTKLVGDAPDDYTHAQKYLEQQIKEKGHNVRVQTLSKSEWEASSLYLTFAFEKVRNTWMAGDKPNYES